ncbi:MAG: Fic family protein [Acidimicrobiales bacterium]
MHDGRDRDLVLPGLRVTARRGAGPQDDDIPLPGGLHLASRARAFAENAIPSRSRRGGIRRRLTRHELGEQIDQALRLDGPDRLDQYRSRAGRLGPVVGAAADRLADLDDLVGVALGTRTASSLPPVLDARRHLRPCDPDRTTRFDLLVAALRAAPPQSRPATLPAGPALPFFEAYFSNFIEGTGFTVEEAGAIIFEGRVPEGRAADAHDITGTFRVVSDVDEMSRLAGEASEFIDLLRSRHATVMAGRPDKRPGQFKDLANQAGATQFVDPGLVEGTLSQGFARLAELDTAWERSVYAMFVVSEVHPFDDGNGRVARIAMNSELVAGGQARIIVPTVFRTDYLGALRRMSRQDDPSVLIKALRYAHDWTSRIDFTDLDVARDQMRDTNGFESPEDGVRLLMPAGTMFAEPKAIELRPEPKPPTGAVRAHTRRDGTPVRAHRRAPHR